MTRDQKRLAIELTPAVLAAAVMVVTVFGASFDRPWDYWLMRATVAVLGVVSVYRPIKRAEWRKAGK